MSWAYIEAANFTVCHCHCLYANSYYKRKLKKTGKRVITLEAVAVKLARATYYLLKDGMKYDLAFNSFPGSSFKNFLSSRGDIDFL